MQVLKAITIRRGIIFTYVMCCAFLVAHIVNAVIAEALSVPVSLIGPSSASARETDVNAALPVLVERIRTSGLFPLPPDPLGVNATGFSAPPARAPLNLASKLKLLGVVIGDREGFRRLLKNSPANASYFSSCMNRYPMWVRSAKSAEME